MLISSVKNQGVKVKVFGGEKSIELMRGLYEKKVRVFIFEIEIWDWFEIVFCQLCAAKQALKGQKIYNELIFI